MTDSEKRNIIDEVLLAIRTNSRTINQLMPVSSLNGTDSFEVSGGRRVSFSTLAALISSHSVDTKVNSLESDVTTLQKARTYPIGGFVDSPDDMLYPYGEATIGGQPNTRLKWVGFHNEWYHWFLKNDYVGNGTDGNPQYRKGLYEVIVDAQTEDYAIGERISLPYATIGILCTGAVYKISNQGFTRLNGLTWGYNATTRKLTLTDDEGAGSIEVTLPLSTETEAGLMSAADKQTLTKNTNAIGALPIIHAVPFDEASDTPDVWCWKLNGHRAAVTMLHGNTTHSLDHPAIVEVNGEFWLWKSSADVTQRIAGELDLAFASAGGSATADTSVWVMNPQTDNVQLGLTTIPVEQRKRGMLASLILGGRWVLLQSKHTAEDDLSGQQWHNMNCWTIVAHEDVNAAKNYQAIQAIKDATCDIAPSDILPYSDYINLGVQSWDSPSDVDAEMLAQMLAEKNKMLMYNVLLYWRKGDTMIAWQYTAEPEDWENQPMASGIDEEGNLNTTAVQEFLALPGWTQVYPTWQLVPKSDAQFDALEERFFDINSRLWMKAEAEVVAERFDNIGATDIDEYMTATHPDMIDLGESRYVIHAMRQYIDSVSSDLNRPNDELFAAMKTNVFKWTEEVGSGETIVHYFKFECTRDEFVAADTDEAMRALAIDASPKTTIEGLHTKMLNNELAITEVDANARRLSQYRIFDLRDFQRNPEAATNVCAAINDAVSANNSVMPSRMTRLANALKEFRFGEGDVMVYTNGEDVCFSRLGNQFQFKAYYVDSSRDWNRHDTLMGLIMPLKEIQTNWTDVDINELGSTAYLQKQLDGIDQYIVEVANPNFRDIMQGLIDREQAVEHIEAECAEDLFPNAYNLADDAPNVANATSIEGAISAWLNADNSNTDGVLKNRLTHGGIKFFNADTGAWECYIYEGTDEQWVTNLTNAITAPDEAVIAAMLTRTPQALNIRQLYGKLLSHILDWQRAEENFNGLFELIENMLERIDALEALTANTVEMEVTYDDDTTETFHLVNVPSAVAPQEEEEE